MGKRHRPIQYWLRSCVAEYLVRGATESNKEKQVGLANMTDDNLRWQAALCDSGRVLCTPYSKVERNCALGALTGICWRL